MTDERGASAGTWVGFSAMTLGMFMAVLDIQIVVTSLPDISEALAIAPDQMSWVQTAYLIAEGWGSRLRRCQRESCATAFVDTSRNGTRRFCSVRCANQVNVSNHRVRRRARS